MHNLFFLIFGNYKIAVAVAYSCAFWKVKGIIFVPQITPQDKINRITDVGKEYVKLKVTGINLPECEQIANNYSQEHGLFQIFQDDKRVVEGCGSVGIEILEDFPLKGKIDYLIFPLSTGTLCAGLASYFQQLSPETKIVGVTPAKSDNSNHYEPMFKHSESLLKFMKDQPNFMELVIPEGETFEQVLQLYNYDGIVLEPLGCLAPAALKILQDEMGQNSLKGKSIVCILTGMNSTISRMNDIKILANVYSKKYLYLLIDFFRKAEAIKEFLTYCLSPEDEVLQIEYTKKSSREKGPALVGIEIHNSANYDVILNKMKELEISYKIILPSDEIFQLKV